MRNQLYPGGIATYLPASELASLAANGITPARDYLFGTGDSLSRRQAKLSGVGKDEPGMPDTSSLPGTPVPRIDLESVPAARAHEILSALLPPTLTFVRTPILNSPETAAQISRAATSSQPADTFVPPEETPIYGSVSAADILARVRAALAADADPEAASVAGSLRAEDVALADAPGDADRVRTLGAFAFVVRVRGAADVRRGVRVVAEGAEDAPDNTAPPSSAVPPDADEVQAAPRAAEPVGDPAAEGFVDLDVRARDRV